MIIKGITPCKICGGFGLKRFISFGKMPVANAFLKKEDLERPEYTYDMEVGFCDNCKMVQLIENVPYEKYIVPDMTGKTKYAFFSSTSKFMEEHFAEFAREVEAKFLKENLRVLELGSNDGIMLKAFKNRRNVLGIEPSHNVADIAISLGIETIKDFFTEGLARKLLAERGKFKAILSTNVFLNIIDIHSAMNGISALLEDDGIFATEDPYIMDILEKTSYDQIYDEHVWYFSLSSLSNLCRMHGMEVFDAERQWVHGGSMRVYMCKKGAYEKTERLKKYIDEEEKKGIAGLQAYLNFAKNVEESKLRLIELLMDLKAKGKKIVGYAAASKGTIVQNYCNIGTDIMDYISDSTPFKQGLFSPGKHIPVVSPDFFHNDKDANYAVLGAWNHAKEIMAKEKDFVARGGRFIVHMPHPHIVEAGEFDNLGNQNNNVKNNEKIINEKGGVVGGNVNENIVRDVKNEGKSANGLLVDNGRANGVSEQIGDKLNIETKQLKIFANDQGYLFDTITANDKIFDGKFGQVLVSEVYPGVIKGLHLHHKQIDYTTCIKGNVKYVAVKEKADGTNEIRVLVVGEKNPVLIKTPPEIWHGYMPLGNQPATILHMMDKVYDFNEPDTERKDVYAFGDVWTVKPS